MAKTHRYGIKAKVRSSFQYDDDYLICKPSEVSEEAKKFVKSDVERLSCFGGQKAKAEDIELSNLEITDLGPCTTDFYETGEC